MKILFWFVLIAGALWALDRLALWAESRGWIYYRHRHGSPGSAAAAFMEVQSLLEPRVKHAAESLREERGEEDESGGPPSGFPCRVVATREPDSSLWSFHLVNDGEEPIEAADLEAVKYEFGDQYLGGESPHAHVANLAPGERALVWTDDGSSEMRTDLWIRIKHAGGQTWLLFEFPKLYRQRGDTLVAEPTRVPGPPA